MLKRVLVPGLVAAVGFAVACDDELEPPTTGSIALNIEFLPDTTTPPPVVVRAEPPDSTAAATEVAREATQERGELANPRSTEIEEEDVAPKRASGAGAAPAPATPQAPGTSPRGLPPAPSLQVAGFDAVRAQTQGGPTARSINLTLVDGFWEGELTGLAAGTYTVLIEAFVGSELDSRAVSTSVTVTPGATPTASVSVTQGSFRPRLNAVPAPGVSTTVSVSFSAVNGAESYRVEWSKNPSFAGVQSATSTQTSAQFSVADSGLHYVRARALATGVTGRASDSTTFTVQVEPPNASGDDAGSAPFLGFGTAANQTLTGLNIVPAGDQDWFTIDACAEDTLIVETRAQRLSPPSTLNTQLRLFDSGNTQIAENNDSAGTDSFIRRTLPGDDRFGIQVTGVANTVGEYELIIDLRPGQFNDGTQCQISAPATVDVSPPTATMDAFGATQQLTATARDTAGNPIVGVGFVWMSDNPSAADVDQNGLVTAFGNGIANITATSQAPPPAVEAAHDTTRIEPDVERPGKAGRALGDRVGRTPITTATAAGALPAGQATITVQQAPATVNVAPGTSTLVSFGETVQLAADVQDRLGSTIVGAAVSWSSDASAIASVDTLGLVTARTNGSATITATSDTVSGTAGVTVAQVPTGIVKSGGDNQTGFAGVPLATQLVARVVDALGSGVAGQTVTWTVTAGGGTLTSANTTTSPNGFAQTGWTLGGSAGAQTVSATFSASTVTFTANAVTGVQWTNAAGGNWNSGANWSTGVVPTSTDAVLIGLDGNYTVTLDVAPTVAFLQVGGGGANLQTLETAGFDLTITGALSVSTAGVMQLTGGSTVNADTMLFGGSGLNGVDGFLDATVIHNTSFIDGRAPGVTIDVTDEFVNAGELKAFANGSIGFGSGTFTHTAAGLIAVGVDAVLDFTLPNASFDGAVLIDTAGTVFFDGATVTATPGFRVAVDGELDLTNTTLTADSIHNQGSVNLDGSTINGPIGNLGLLYAGFGSNLVAGRVTTGASSSIVVEGETTDLTVSTALTNNGSVLLTTSTCCAGQPALFVNTLTNMAGALVEFAGPAGALLNAGTVFDNRGNFNVQSGGSSIVAAGTVTNDGASGDMFINGNVRLGPATSAGIITITTSNSLLISDGTSFTNTGFLQGGGTLDLLGTASFTNSGSIGVGPTVGLGILTIDGDVTLTSSSVLEFELLGQTPGVDMDALIVTGTITLDGALSVIPDNAFDFTYGNSHQIMAFAARSGGFSDVSSLDFGGTGAFRLYQSFSANDLVLGLSVPQVVVTPSSPTISQLGGTVQLSAEAREFDATPIMAIPFTWNAIDPTVVSVDGTGLVTALTPGTSDVDAVAIGGAAATVTVAVTAAGIASVTVTPEGPSIDGVGNTFQFAAEVRDSTNTVVLAGVTWNTGNPNVATIDPTGLATAVGPGQTTVSAQAGGFTGFATVNVLAPGLSLANVWADDGSPTMVNLRDVWGAATNDVWAIGNNGTVLHYDGASWSIVDIGAGTLNLTEITGTSASNIYVIAFTGDVFRFDGIQWTQLPAPGGNIRGIWVAAPDDVWISQSSGTVSHWDGSTWTPTSTPSAEDLFHIWGSSGSDVWAAGRNGAIVHYNGTQWSTVASGTAQNINELWGAAGNDIWAVASVDTLLHYNGTTWSATSVGTGTFFLRIFGFDRQDIYAIGTNGANEEIWHYDGVGWTVIGGFDFNTTGDMQGLVATPNPTLVAVTSNGTILRGHLGGSVTVTPTNPTIVAPEDTVQLTANVADGGGNPITGANVTWMSGNQTLFPVDPTGLVMATTDGLQTTVTATVPGGASGQTTVSSDFSFTGTASATTFAFGDTVVLIPDPAIPWTGGETVDFGGLQGFVLAQTVDSIAVAATGPATGPFTITIGNQGAGGFTQSLSANLTSVFTPNGTAASATTNFGNGPFPREIYISLSGAAPDHYVRLDPTAATLGANVTLEWQNAADLNVIWTNNVGTQQGNLDGATGNNPERSGEAIPALNDWRLRLHKFDGSGTPETMARVRIEQTTVGTSITAGEFHSCAINVDGDAQCWGGNDFGQLGDGTQNFSATPVNVIGGLPFTAIDAGAGFTCGIVENGDAYCWGNGTRGQLGNGSSVSSTTPVLVTGGVQFVEISAGGFHVCGIDTGGEIHCWGSGFSGELGDGGQTSRASPGPISMAGPWLQVTAGSGHTCALDGGSQAHCWGANFAGQVGDASNTDRLVPVAVSGSPVLREISAGFFHTCGVNAVGATATCWGSGFGNVPLAVPGGFTFASLDGGQFHTCGVRTAPIETRCWGTGTYGQLGNGSTAFQSTPVVVSSVVGHVSVAAGGHHSCAIDGLGIAECWGRNGNGQLGDGSVPLITPQSLGPGLTVLDVGTQHTCGINTTGAVFCWGQGASGQLGDGAFTTSTSPIIATTVNPYVQVSAGGSHTCGVDNTATIFCWGSGGAGEIGDGFNLGRGTPTQVSGMNSWLRVAVGNRFTCAIDTSGAAFCWGTNSNGELGDGTTTPRNVPTPIASGERFTDISAGGFHACGITTGGDAYCWGFNGVGELGNGMSGGGANPNPVLVLGGLSFVQIEAGRQYTCARTGGDEVYCWGLNSGGQHGTGGVFGASSPQLAAGGALFQSVQAGLGTTSNSTTCGVTGAGGGFCWGTNTFGQVGDGTQTPRLDPVGVSGAITWALISPGRDFSCGIDTGTVVYCWGDNSDGYLGLGSGAVTAETTPVSVVGNNPFRIRADTPAMPSTGAFDRPRPASPSSGR